MLFYDIKENYQITHLIKNMIFIQQEKKCETEYPSYYIKTLNHICVYNLNTLSDNLNCEKIYLYNKCLSDVHKNIKLNCQEYLINIF